VVIVTPSALTATRRDLIVSLAARFKLPAIWREKKGTKTEKSGAARCPSSSLAATHRNERRVRITPESRRDSYRPARQLRANTGSIQPRRINRRDSAWRTLGEADGSPVIRVAIRTNGASSHLPYAPKLSILAAWQP
jgi:hypothetical protein